jgi:CDP-diacylglycerol--glycerol-3-phosphate 3-phosphatidyltransferase/CDP-diacylglycerol--inositol 3-phosphatidyltransferase
MLERFRAFWTNVWKPVAHMLIRLGVTPNMVTFFGTVGVVTGALVFFPRGELLIGVLVITAFVFSDLIDGAMARKIGRTDDFGAFLDSTLDRIADAALFGAMALFFAWQTEDRLYLVLSLVCLVMGSVTSYARSKGEQLGYNAKTGLAERPDRLVGLLVPTFFGDLFGLPIIYEIALWLIAALSTITVVQRVLLVRRQALARAAGAESAEAPPQH